MKYAWPNDEEYLQSIHRDHLFSSRQTVTDQITKWWHCYSVILVVHIHIITEYWFITMKNFLWLNRGVQVRWWEQIVTDHHVIDWRHQLLDPPHVLNVAHSYYSTGYWCLEHDRLCIYCTRNGNGNKYKYMYYIHNFALLLKHQSVCLFKE